MGIIARMQGGGTHRWQRFGAAAVVAPFRRLFSWFCLLLLAANLVGGAALPIASSAAQLTPLPSDGVIVVCTAAGMRLIDPSGKAPPVSAAEHGGMCSHCLPLLQGGVVAPTLVTATPVAVAVRVVMPMAAGVEIGHACRRPVSSRAPPVV